MSSSNFQRKGRRLVAAILLLTSFAAPGPANAQEEAHTSSLPVFEMADRQDWVLRVGLSNGTVVEGRVRDIDGTSVRLEGGRFDVADVETIERAERRSGGSGEGATVGAVLLAVGTLLFAFDGGFGSGGTSVPGVFLLLGMIAAIGAVVGGVMGAALEPSETEWLPVWPGAGEP